VFGCYCLWDRIDVACGCTGAVLWIWLKPANCCLLINILNSLVQIVCFNVSFFQKSFLALELSAFQKYKDWSIFLFSASLISLLKFLQISVPSQLELQ
jgi:hypothetical protein